MEQTAIAQELVKVARLLLGNDGTLAAKLAKDYVRLPLECDGLTRVISYLLTKNKVPHDVMLGSVSMKDGKRAFSPHFWIVLRRTRQIVDYRARM